MLIDHNAIKELDGVSALISWSRVEKLMSEMHCSCKGEEAWLTLRMFETLLLQSGYSLSDPQLEKQIVSDRLFRRFVELDITELAPDHSTFWRFLQKLDQLSLMDSLLEEINHQLSEQGLHIKSGEISIVAESVIEFKQTQKRQFNTRPRSGVECKKSFGW